MNLKTRKKPPKSQLHRFCTIRLPYKRFMIANHIANSPWCLGVIQLADTLWLMYKCLRSKVLWRSKGCRAQNANSLWVWADAGIKASADGGWGRLQKKPATGKIIGLRQMSSVSWRGSWEGPAEKQWLAISNHQILELCLVADWYLQSCTILGLPCQVLCQSLSWSPCLLWFSFPLNNMGCQFVALFILALFSFRKNSLQCSIFKMFTL